MFASDHVASRIRSDAEARRRLTAMRGGCSCYLKSPCFACASSITTAEARALGFPDDASPHEAPPFCPRPKCEEWDHASNAPARPKLVERHGTLVCPKCRTSFGDAPADESDPMKAVRDFCK